jgi:hypothetical protein
MEALLFVTRRGLEQKLNVGEFWAKMEDRTAMYSMCDDLLLAVGVFFDQNLIDQRTGCSETGNTDPNCNTRPLREEIRLDPTFYSVERYFLDPQRPTWLASMNEDPISPNVRLFSF